MRATRFKLSTKIVGVDADFSNGTTAKDLQALLKGFTAGQTVQVRVVASNDGGDAAPSPVAEAVVT